MFIRLAHQYREFVKDLVMNLQALAIVLEKRGYIASCYTCGIELTSASFMVSLGDNHLIRFLVSDYGITWTEMQDDRELMKLEGAEAISQLEELANLVKYQVKSFDSKAPSYDHSLLVH
jgi:phosphoenolpyruvate carboxylase